MKFCNFPTALTLIASTLCMSCTAAFNVDSPDKKFHGTISIIVPVENDGK